MRRRLIVAACALAAALCLGLSARALRSAEAGPVPPPPPPAELSELDRLRVENALLREQQACRPVQEAKEALLRELEARYHFSVAAGDTLDKDLRTIVRAARKEGSAK